jgi:hemerythrin
VPLVELSRIPQVALPFINQDHQVEGDLLNRLHEALAAHRGGGPGEPVKAAFEKLLAHTREHFAREEQAMMRAGFPPYPVHKEEHDRVLEEMEEEGRAFGEKGDRERLWRYVSEAVPSWFVSHIQSMDAITAQFVSMRGG